MRIKGKISEFDKTFVWMEDDKFQYKFRYTIGALLIGAKSLIHKEGNIYEDYWTKDRYCLVSKISKLDNLIFATIKHLEELKK